MNPHAPKPFTPIQAGLVGFGLAGRILHAPLLRAAGFTVGGVVTRAAEAVANALPEAQVLPDIDALLALRDVRLVIIASPNDLHEAMAAKALQAGRCVVVEKPLAMDLAAVDRLLQVASNSPGSLTVFHNRRWDSDFLTVQELIAADTLGSVHHLESRWNRYRPQVLDRWRERPANGGGLLLDLGTHLLDQALQLFGKPDWVQADIQCRRAGAVVDDSFEIRLGLGQRRIVIGADCLSAAAGPRFVLHGARASFTKFGLDVQEAQLRANRSPLDADFGVEPEAQNGQLTDGAGGQPRPFPSERGRWLDFYLAVRAHLESGGPLPVVPTEAREVLRLIEAARRSAATGSRIALD